MRMDCETARESLDAWALGALDADEGRALDAHLTGCDACASLAGEARVHAASLALAVPLRAAGPSLKARIIASAAVLSEVPKPRSLSRWWAVAAAALLFASAGGLSWGAILQTRVNDLQSRNERVGAQATQQSNQFATVRTQISQADVRQSELLKLISSQEAVIDVVTQPDVTRTQLAGSAVAPQATGRYLWSPTASTGVFVASNLPRPPDGQRYELWIVYEREWLSGGTFDVDDQGYGRLVVADVERDSDSGRLLGFAVTLEPVVGVRGHSGATVMSSGGTR